MKPMERTLLELLLTDLLEMLQKGLIHAAQRRIKYYLERIKDPPILNNDAIAKMQIELDKLKKEYQ